MKNIDRKIKDLTQVVNNCSPSGYFHYKFQEFCSSIFVDNGESSPYIIEPEYIKIFAEVEKSMPSDLNEIEDGPRYFAFGIFCFRAYIIYCLRVACATRRGAARLSKYVESNYLTDDLVVKIHELYIYFNREENEDLEKDQIKFTTDVFYFLNDVSKMDMPFGAAGESEEEIKASSEHMGSAFVYFMDAILLCFTNLFNFLDTLLLLSADMKTKLA